MKIKNNIFDFDKESLKDKITNMNNEDLKQLQNSILYTKQITKEYFSKSYRQEKLFERYIDYQYS